ncbi:MAG: GTP cyclohydrolase IV [Candidatus Altiarchaeales archaeon]|nr:MAG: GTP cyclohydrolase IV [Candidatus Altiarchaeales archaeon]RLI94925.1 MAG: GTP cyclohydrolase IV [Candidatus Altiarchaeales archaeon]RLI95182.1 MAG: GTP cyclohydrolase IV [Candidatus Altiarchaeales archaeon]HDO82419.1 GTP cyclohydrolase IV [Candidatus Altiarchaeales archaeon]HEX55068.1 GTP cyclohydrolase IV [Candidatus Altiarchaeales archaeon]
MQDSKPEIMKNLDRVGITGLRTIVMTKWKGKRYNFVPDIELTIDLEKEKKGVHMSRLIESVIECIESEIEVRHNSLEELERHILEKLKEKHPYKKSEIEIKTELVIPKKTPVTGKLSMETYDISVKLFYENGEYRKRLRVGVIGNTVCPHAMEKNEGKTHMQRAYSILEIETSYDNEIALEDMIDCVEISFPSRVYTLLKTEDEKYVVKKMFENPKFVEDVTRSILDNAKKRFKNCRIKAKTISEESIHRHNVMAEGSCES